MKPKHLLIRSAWQLALMLLVFCAATSSFGATWNYYLQAGVTTIPAGAYYSAPGPPAVSIPGETILLWGYAQCTDVTFGSCGPVTVPGPTLVASENDTLNIYLSNNLTVAAGTAAGFPSMMTEPTSIIIRGQNIPLNPTWVSQTTTAAGTVTSVVSTGSRIDLASRVRSFTTETATGSKTGVYTFASLKPGTYLYQSGTHPAVQVQMGLYGALKVYPLATPALPGPPVVIPASPQAYDTVSTLYNTDVVLLYSEIDPELHYSVGSGLYGTPPPPPPGVPVRGQRTSAVDYKPKFFLINGKPFAYPYLPLPVLSPVPIIKTGQKTLLRFLNAGLKEKTPTFANQYMSIIAEDGNLLPYPRKQYGTLLPAGKTLDVLWSPSVLNVASYNAPLFDRSLNLTNGAMSPGGMLVYLAVIDPPATPASAGNVSIVNATYSAKKQRLTLTASTDSPNTILTAIGFGDLTLMSKKKGTYLFKGVFTGVASKPESIVVNGSNGGSATQSMR
jgi:FtsP/CotA-like multicopper oxidase with cupredoxin domain